MASAQQAAIASASSAFDFRSPSLEIICDQFAEDRKHSILDLGAPNGRNIEFFSRVPCRLYVEDLFKSLICIPPPENDEEQNFNDKRISSALSHPLNTRFDVIFGWDLFNYMHGDLIHALMKRLSGSAHSGTLLFIMISTTPTIPNSPARITVTPEGRVCYEPSVDGERANPRYTPLALERMMPGFRLLHSFLLGTAMQDYLFSFE